MKSIFPNHTRLHQLIVARDWDAVIARSGSHPSEAKRWTMVQIDGMTQESRILPLHQAFLLQPPKEAVNALVAAYPKSVIQKDSLFHRTPLHFACLKGASAEAIGATCLPASNGSAAMRDATGTTPLVYAIVTGAPTDVIRILLLAYREGARVQDKKGWLPLHVAFRYASRQDVMRELLEAYPESVSVKTKSGLTPVMCAQISGFV